jgi:formylglycine-generating enzyme required for sulfatase activity
MTSFAESYLSKLAADLSARVISAAGARVAGAFAEAPQTKALGECTRAGLIALFAKSTADQPGEEEHLQSIYSDFFRDDYVARELSKLLRGRPLDLKELEDLFYQAGYNPKSLPGLHFETAVSLFARAFVDQAVQHPDLEGCISAGAALEQVDLQRGSLDELKRIRELLENFKMPIAGISAGSIEAQNVVNGVQIVMNWDPEARNRDEQLSLHDAYLHRVQEEAGKLSLAGIDPRASANATKQLDLSAIYTALMTRSRETELEPDKEEPRMRMDREEPARLSALAMLDAHKHLVLLGDPGGGKSTFVNFTAACLAGELLGKTAMGLERLREPLPPDEDVEEDEQPEPQPWSHGALIPVRVILRDFAARGLRRGKKARAKDLWNFISMELKSCDLGDCAPHLREAMRKEEGCLLLLDGLDEVPEAHQCREQIKATVEDFVKTYTHCRVLVTSRTYAYRQQDWRLADFEEATLSPFERGQVRLFIENWYEHLAVIGVVDGETARDNVEVLKHAVLGNEKLFDLARRPLLLTLMASLHAYRGGTLPDKRVQLYGDIVDLLLDWWMKPKVEVDGEGNIDVKSASLSDHTGVEKDEMLGLLSELAFEVHAAQEEGEGVADLPEEWLLGALARLSREKDTSFDQVKLIDTLLDRVGILIPRGHAVYAFPHRTIQEYLAACHLTGSAQGFPDQLAELVRGDPGRWREVALLGAAKAAQGAEYSLWALVDRLCGHTLNPGEEQTGKDAWGAVVAGQALLECADLSKVSEPDRFRQQRVQQHLVAVLESGDLPAAERAGAGRTLARLGDPRFSAVHWDLPPPSRNLGFIEIPRGKFFMGKVDDIEEVELDSYYIAKYPVTVAQFDQFTQDGGYSREEYWTLARQHEVWSDGKIKSRGGSEARSGPAQTRSPFNLPNHPVVEVTWYEMIAYCRWLTEKLRSCEDVPEPLRSRIRLDGWKIGLPSEAEWEKAARGTGKGEFPFDGEPDPERANYAATGLNSTSAVGAFPQDTSETGCLDMAGNILEWTRSEYDNKYPRVFDDGKLGMKADIDTARVLRGGSWYDSAEHLRCAIRIRNFPNGRFDHIGFRVVCSPFSEL